MDQEVEVESRDPFDLVVDSMKACTPSHSHPSLEKDIQTSEGHASTHSNSNKQVVEIASTNEELPLSTLHVEHIGDSQITNFRPDDLIRRHKAQMLVGLWGGIQEKIRSTDILNIPRSANDIYKILQVINSYADFESGHLKDMMEGYIDKATRFKELNSFHASALTLSTQSTKLQDLHSSLRNSEALEEKLIQNQHLWKEELAKLMARKTELESLLEQADNDLTEHRRSITSFREEIEKVENTPVQTEQDATSLKMLNQLLVECRQNLIDYKWKP